MLKTFALTACLLAIYGSARADPLLYACTGSGLNERMDLLPDQTFFFKFDPLIGKVTFFEGQGITKFEMTRVDADSLWFKAETQYAGQANSAYIVALDRNTGRGTIAAWLLNPDGRYAVRGRTSFMVTCAPSKKVF